MANFFSLQDGNLTDSSVYGYSLTGAEIMNNTTGTMLLTSSLYSSNGYSDGSSISALAVHLSARNADPLGTLGLTIQRTASAGTFLDSGSNNLTVTTVGSAYQNTFSPFSPNGWSGYFNGSTGYIITPTNSVLNLSGTAYTIEFWINPLTIATGTRGIINLFVDGITTNAGLNFYQDTANIKFNNGTLATTGSGTLNNPLSVGVWTHVALASQNVNSHILYINGVSAARYNNPIITASVNKAILGNWSSLGGYFNGYISNLRVVKGTALYTTATFTPSSTPLSSTGSDTSLLTLQDNRFKDNSSNNFTLTAYGSAAIKDTSPFTPVAVDPAIHGGSGVFGVYGANGTWLVPSNNLIAFESSSVTYTVEAWIYPTQYSNSQIISNRTTGGAQIIFGAGGTLTYSNIGGGTIVTSNSSVPINAWTYVTVIKSNANVYLYVNGVYKLSGSPANSTAAGASVFIGNSNTNDSGFSGYISNMRVVSGAAYTLGTNFTPPTNPTTKINNTLLLLNTSNYGFQASATETYAISSFTSYDGSNNLLTPYPQNWQILNLTNPLSTNRNDVINYTLNTSDLNQLSLMGASGATDITGVNKLSSVGTPLLTSFKPYTNFGDSLYLKGITDWFTIPANTNLTFNGDFTIECWLKTPYSFAGPTGEPSTLFSIGANATTGHLRLYFVKDTSGNYGSVLSLKDNNTVQIAGTLSAANDQWNHIALVRCNNAVRLYVNGQRSGSTYASNSIYNLAASSPISIGAYNNSANGVLSAAYINQFRIVNGTSVYTTSAFTPPTTPLTVIPNTVFLMNNGVRYDQALIASTSARPTSADNIHIGGSLKGLTIEPRTITASTSTFQNLYIHNQGTLTFPLTSNKTLTLFGSAGLQITSDGTLNIGTSSSLVPLSTTHIISLSNTQIDVHNGGVLNAYGYPKTYTTNLASDYLAGSNKFIITNSISSIWSVGDTLVFKPNLTARNGFDTLTIASFVSSDTLSTTSNSVFMHTGSANYSNVIGVFNLNRNVKIQGLNSTARGSIRTIDAAKTNVNFVQLSNFGINAFNKNGFILGNNLSGYTEIIDTVIDSVNIPNINNIVPLTGRTFQNTNIYNNIINRSSTLSLTSLSVNNINIINNYILSANGTGLNMSNLSGSVDMSNNITIGSLGYGTYLYNNKLSGTYGATNYNSALQGMFLSGSNTGIIVGGGLNSVKEGVYVDASTSNLSGLSFQYILANNNSSVGFRVSGNNLNYLTPVVLNINGLIANSNTDSGFEGYNITGNINSASLNNNYLYGMKTSIGNGNMIFDGLVSVVSGTSLIILSALNYNQTIIKNAVLSSTRPVLGVGLSLNIDKLEEFRLENSTLSAATPFQITSTRAKIEGSYLFHNSNSNSYNLSSIVLAEYQSEVFTETGFSVMNENGLSGNKYRMLAAGRISYDTTTVHTLSNIASEKLEPMSDTIKLRSGSKYIPVNAGDSFVITAHVRRSSSYTGTAPRLMLKGNSSLGYTDTVLATSAGYNGVWVGINGVINNISKSGIVEVYVDCSGPMGCGSINIDDWELI